MTPYAHIAGPDVVTEWVQLVRSLTDFMHPSRPVTPIEQDSYLAEAAQHAAILHDRLLALLKLPDGDPGQAATPPPE